MKWFKHMTRSWDDQGLARLVSAGGMEGLAVYGLWWRVVEVVADQLDQKGVNPSATYPLSRWSTLLSLRGSLVFSALSRLAVTGGVTVERLESDIRVTIPNLLKYRDEYSRKSGHAPDNIPPRTEGDKEADTDTKKKQVSSQIPRSVPPEELAGTLPLVNGTLYEVSKSQVTEWSQAFPGVDVKQELKKFKVWCDADPTRRKTPRGIGKAIFRWLSNAQDGGSSRRNNGRPNDSNKSARTISNVREIFTNAGADHDGAGRRSDPAGSGGREGLFAEDDGRVIEGAIG